MPERAGGEARPEVALVLASSTGGVGRHVRSVSAALADRGWPVRVVGPAATEARFGFRAAGARFVPVEVGPTPRPGRDLVALARLAAALWGADLVHAHGVRAAALAALVPGRRPLVATWHNRMLGGRARRAAAAALERLAARRATVALAASSDLLAHLHTLGARDARLAPVAAPALSQASTDPRQLRAALGAQGRPLVVAVGRLHPQKGFDTLVAAAAMLRDHRPLPLVVIAGEGPQREVLQARIAATAAPVRLLGHRADVADLLAAADLAVLPSVWEARALVAQEALRAGVPLVASRVGGIPELVGEAAVLVPPGDPGRLARALAGLLADEPGRARLAAAGTARAATWPTEDETTRALLCLYLELTVGRAVR